MRKNHGAAPDSLQLCETVTLHEQLCRPLNELDLGMISESKAKWLIEAKHYSDQARKLDRLQYRKKLWGAHRESLGQGTLGAFEVSEDGSFELVNDDQASVPDRSRLNKSSENSESPSKGTKGPRPRYLRSSIGARQPISAIH